jgi:hypothetical protein
MVAILFEGISDEDFFNSIVSEYQLPIKEIVFLKFDGKDNLFKISHTNYDSLESDIDVGRVTKALLVVDADNEKDKNPNRGFKASKDKLEEIIRDLDFDIPLDYYIMCDQNKEGNLESFLLSVLEDEQKECILKFRECYKYNLTDKWAYNSFYKQMREPFDFNHTNFNLLKEKLTNLFS